MDNANNKSSSYAVISWMVLVGLIVVLVYFFTQNIKIASQLEMAQMKLTQKPAMPISVSMREAMLGSGLVAQFSNHSDRFIGLLITLTNPTTTQNKTIRLDIDANSMGTRLFGRLDIRLRRSNPHSAKRLSIHINHRSITTSIERITMKLLLALALFVLVHSFTYAEGISDDIEKGVGSVADGIAPPDIVTGKRLLNMKSEADEIAEAEKNQAAILNQARLQGYAVNADQLLLAHLQDIMRRVASVSHRPNLPWEVHLIESPEINAFTIGGGKIFFFRGAFGGLIDQASDNEIAGVMAHEMGHVAARHLAKREGSQLIGLISHKAKKRAENNIYQASYSSQQEDEADRIGLLYMSLAGYDPQAIPVLWNRASAKYGDKPGDYTYDHSLSKDRAVKAEKLMSIALEYYAGQDQINNNYTAILESNQLLPRDSISEGGNAYLAALNVLFDNYKRMLETDNEALSRQINLKNDQFKERINAMNAARLTRVNFQIANTTNGYRALFGKFQNLSNKTIKSAIVTIYYVDAVGKPILSEEVQIESNGMHSGQVVNWQSLLRNVPRSSVIANVTQVIWDN